ncbi:hypothetical protein ACRQ5D_10660 [Mucilaginibacter sp. P25]|uniref:hypothetical protein n=1 Tax=Mucilaginibacter sp. P25 TaxID=3423945 RepID=UPI003D7B325C
MVNRGAVLEKYIRKERVNVTLLSQKLPWTVKTIYRHFQEEQLPLEKMAEYAKALKYDFHSEVPELAALKNVVHDPYVPYKTQSETNNDELDYRRKYEDVLEKYTDILVKYNALLEQRLADK